MYEEKKIFKDEILLPPFQYRFEYVQEINPSEIDPPIKVVLSKESDKYIPIEGISIYREGRRCGVEYFTCEIVSEVSSDFEGFIEGIRFIPGTKTIPFNGASQGCLRVA